MNLLPKQMLTTESRDFSVAFANSVRNNAAYRAIEKETDIEDNRLMFY